jgi:hypothetical protein
VGGEVVRGGEAGKARARDQHGGSSEWARHEEAIIAAQPGSPWP